MKHNLSRIIFFVGVLLIVFQSIYLYLTPHYIPKVQKIDLIPILQKKSLTEMDYNLLYEQTGLSASIINELMTEPNYPANILCFQQDYLARIHVHNNYLPPLTFCQTVTDNSSPPKKAFTLAPYHNGYIFLPILLIALIGDMVIWV